MKNLGQETWTPSAVPLDLGKHSKMFAAPKPMTEQEIAGLRGVEGYGLPKWKTAIDLDIGDTNRACRRRGRRYRHCNHGADARAWNRSCHPVKLA
jgi:hypothetical protein